MTGRIVIRTRRQLARCPLVWIAHAAVLALTVVAAVHFAG